MHKNLQKKGLMLVLSSPSGAGKTTLAKALLSREKKMRLSVSATTRAPRPGEKEGKDYFFLKREDFFKKIKNGEFLEYAEVFGHLYGTLKKEVEKNLEKGIDQLFDIDWQGTQQLSQQAGSDIVRIFILPPSRKILEERLKKRAQDSPDEVQYRMSKAASEISHWAEYDYIIVNDDLEESLEAIQSIVISERLKRSRYIDLKDFIVQFS